MFTTFAVIGTELVSIDDYKTLTEAIRGVIKHWHEDATKFLYVIRDEEDKTVASILPCGNDHAIACLSNGYTEHYRGIKYNVSPTTNRYVNTTAYCGNEHLTI